MKPNLPLATRLTLLFILFALAIIGGVGWLSYASGRNSLHSATVSELHATAIEKQAALNAWVEDRQASVATLATSLSLQEDLAAYTAVTPGSAEAQAAHARLVAELQVYTAQRQFLALLVIEPANGQVIAASNNAEEGKFREDQPYFVNGKDGPFVQNLYYSTALQAPAMTVSAPILAVDGRLLGVLAGRLNLEEMNAIINRRSGLRRSDEAFLVNTSNLFATQPRLAPSKAVLQRGVHTEAVNRCLERNSGVISALDYRGVPALVAYRWLPERGLCLIVKLDEAEALAPVRAFGGTITLVGGFTLLVTFFLALGLARTITRPVLALQTGADRIAQGELTLYLPETAPGELGQLARAFNRMATALGEKESQLRGHAAELERRVAERTAALSDSEERYRSLSDNALVGVYRTTLAGEILYVNDALVKMMEFESREAMRAANVLTRYRDPASRQALLTALQTSGKVDNVELEVLTKNNLPLHILLSATLEGGILSGMIVDITERKQAEEALAASHKRFESLIEHAPDGIALLGLDGMLRQVTPSTQQILGYTLAESIGQDPASMTHPDDLPGLLHLLNDLVQNPGKVGRLQYRFRHRDGSWRWLDSTISNLVSEPSVQAIVFNYRDITGQKQAQEALRRSEERYRGIFDAAPVSIWLEDWTEVITAVRLLRSQGVTDFRQYYADHPEFVQNTLRQVQILDVNDETLAMFKAKAKEEMLASLGVVFATDDTLPGFVGELVALGEGERIYRTEMALRTVQGDLIHVLLTMTFPAEESHSGEVLVSLMDITERRQAEVEIRRLNNELEGRVAQRTLQLEAANKELQAFAYSVSHDLRAPLRGIDGFSQALLKKYSSQLDAEGRHYLNRVRENTQRMGQLIDDMLTLSRVSRQEMSSQPVDLMALAREISKSLTESDAARKVTFKIADQGIVQGDTGLLRVMLQNLFENAWKFTARREHAEIEVGCSDDGTRVFHVRDNGAGFDMQYAGKLFGAFQRLHSPKDYPGTGIGLATVQRVIHRHGGRVWAEAAVNEGATFYFTLGEKP